MVSKDKSTLVLMVQNATRVFCYFNISPIKVKEFEDRYGENSWKNSKPVLKVYFVENGIVKEMQTIFIDAFANNWYINLDKEDVDVFVKLGRVLPDNTFVAFAVSNTVTTPREHESFDSSVYFVDVSQILGINSQTALPKCKQLEEDVPTHKEPKPYPFMNVKKNNLVIPK